MGAGQGRGRIDGALLFPASAGRFPRCSEGTLVQRYNRNWGRLKALKLPPSLKQHLPSKATLIGTQKRATPNPHRHPLADAVPRPLIFLSHTPPLDDFTFMTTTTTARLPRPLELSHGSNNEKKWLVVTLNNCLSILPLICLNILCCSRPPPPSRSALPIRNSHSSSPGNRLRPRASHLS